MVEFVQHTGRILAHRVRSALLLAGAVVATLAGCASPQTAAPAVTPVMLSQAKGASRATLEEGRGVFVGPCTSCHAPDPVGKFSVAEWHRAIDEMAPRAKLDGARKSALLAYVTAAHGGALPPR